MTPANVGSCFECFALGRHLNGVVAAIAPWWKVRAARARLLLRFVGESPDTARALGLRPALIPDLAATRCEAFAGICGALLSLFTPGRWNEGISSGQGLLAVALGVLACGNPIACFGAAILFAGPGRRAFDLPVLRLLNPGEDGKPRHVRFRRHL
ncbi:ABC transporter permease subunit [Maliponia aquimaris]|uniref:ABC transporter permease subunit n=1 Tax=Maliponia aquimaris TaxID=1673631 RepID=UPI000B8B7DF3|nr:hypothetical protein [Maliponia aquimaris]